MFSARFVAGTFIAALLIATVVAVPAHDEIGHAAPVGAIASVFIDGTAAFDADDDPGNDSGPNNGIVRTNDTVQYDFQYNYDGDGATNPVITSILPVGMTWLAVPTDCTGIGSPPTGISVDGRTLTCRLPDSAISVSSRIRPVARVHASEVDHGAVLGVGFGVSDDSTVLPVLSNVATVTVSAAPSFDLAKRPAYRNVTYGDLTLPTGVERSARVQYVATIAAAPASPGRITPEDKAKGVAPLANTFTFSDDVSQVAPNAILDQCFSLSNTFVAPDSYGGPPNGVASSGTVSCAQPGGPGQPVEVTVTGADTSAERLPTDGPFVFSYYIRIWIPGSDLEAGEDGTVGTPDDGFLDTTNVYTDFDPDSRTGVSNYGADVEPLANNQTSQRVRIAGRPGIANKFWANIDSSLPVSTDSRPATEIQFTNLNLTPDTQITCDVFDATAFQLSNLNIGVPVSALGGADAVRIEYGAATVPPTNQIEQRDSLCADTDATWSTDPTDTTTLGGTPTAQDGFASTIDRIRVIWTRPVSDIRHSVFVGLRVIGPSQYPDADGGRELINFSQQQTDGGSWQRDQAQLQFGNGYTRLTKSAAEYGNGTGNLYPAGAMIEFQLDPTVAAAGVPPQPMGNVQVTDILPTDVPRMTVMPGTVSRPAEVVSVEFCQLCDDSDWSTTAPDPSYGVRWNYGDVQAGTPLTQLTFNAAVDAGAPDGTQYLNEATITSTDDNEASSLGRRRDGHLIVIEAPQTVIATKVSNVAEIPVGGDLSYGYLIRNNTSSDLTRLDVVDVLPFNGDGRTPASSFSGTYDSITLSGLPSGMTPYVTDSDGATLDADDGSADGFADPGNPGDTFYVTPGTGIWACTLAQVGTVGCPAVDEVTAVRFAGNTAALLPSQATLQWGIELGTDANVGRDIYTNRFLARVDESELALPVVSRDVVTEVVAPTVEIDKEVCTEHDPVDCDPANDSVWAETMTIDAAGEGVFRLSVTNTGNIVGTVTVDDDIPPGLTYVAGSAQTTTGDGSGFPGTWATGALNPAQTAQMTYRVTTDAPTDPAIVNNVFAEITDRYGQIDTDTDDASIGSTVPSITLDKVAAPIDDGGDGRVDAGDTIDYTFTIDNGPLPLTAVTLTDSIVPAGDVNCPKTTLAPGEQMVCTATYALSQADIDDGTITNNATATGTPPASDPPTSSDSVTTPITHDPSISLDKVFDGFVDGGDGVVDAGDVADYEFVVTNTGNVTLGSISLADVQLDAAASCPATTLAPGASMTCTGTHTLTQAEIDGGLVSNTATVTATPPSGPDVDDTDSVDEPVDTTASISLDKVFDGFGDGGDGVVHAGDTISYEFVVTNTGNVTLTSISLVDIQLDAAASCPVTTLAPGVSTTCTGTHSITQAEIDAGVVSNTATVTGTPPSGPDVDDTDTVDEPVDTTASISLDKTDTGIDDLDANGLDAGDTISYEFVVSNTGNVTLDAITVDDPRITVGTLSCPGTTLGGGESMICTGDHTITQAEIDAGEILNTASVTGNPPAGSAVDDTDDVTTPIDPPNGLSLVKSVASIDDDDGNGTETGDTVRYTFEVTNTGAATLTDLVVTDPLISATPLTCLVDTLAPAASTTCAGDYIVTQADVDNGSIDNTATATAETPLGEPVSAVDDHSEPTVQTASLELVKTAIVDDPDGDGVTVEESVEYEFTVTNTGVVTVTDLRIVDPKVVADCPAATLAPGISTTCTGRYTVTQADVDSGSLDNTATAEATTPNDGVVTSPESSVSVPTETDAALGLTKLVGGTDDASNDGLGVGDTIVYWFTVTNLGDLTAMEITVDDPRVDLVACPRDSLAAGESMICTATYTVTATDVANGSVVNTAAARATTPMSTTMPISTTVASGSSRVETMVPGNSEGERTAAIIPQEPEAPTPTPLPATGGGSFAQLLLLVGFGLLTAGGGLLGLRRRHTRSSAQA